MIHQIKIDLQCHLRPFVYEDAPTILSWCKDKRALRLWSADLFKDFPASPDELLKLNEAQGKFPLTMVRNDKIIGHIMLRYPSNDMSIVRFGLVIIDDTMRGKGLGKKLLLQAIDYARTKLEAKKITLGVFYDNPSALNCYKSVGFNITGGMAYLVDGEKWMGAEMELDL